MARPTAIHQEGRRQSTISLGGRGAEVSRKRGCTAGTVVPGTPSQSSVCCPQKRGRLEANYRPKTTELLPGASSFQNGGLVHANGGPEARMANGKDRPERCVPDNPSGKGTPLSNIIPGTARRMDTISVPPIRTLHRTLCVHKSDQANSPIPTTVGNPPDYISGQFTSSCLKHNTTVTRSFNSPELFTTLGFLINYPKSIMSPTQKLEFLGFMMDTKTMRIALPPQKIDAIQKEASQILSAGSIQIRTLAHFIGTLLATKPAMSLGPSTFEPCRT